MRDSSDPVLVMGVQEAAPTLSVGAASHTFSGEGG